MTTKRKNTDFFPSDSISLIDESESDCSSKRRKLAWKSSYEEDIFERDIGYLMCLVCSQEINIRSRK